MKSGARGRRNRKNKRRYSRMKFNNVEALSERRKICMIYQKTLWNVFRSFVKKC
jgi:hypothetical protein